MDYPIKLGAQLKEQLRSLRKARGLSQADVGALLGVNQGRIADIESKPGSVGFDQVMKVVSALGAELVLRDLAPPSTAPQSPERTRAQTTATADERGDDFEFVLPSQGSVRQLLADIDGVSGEHVTGPFWDATKPQPMVKVPLNARRYFIIDLARAIARSPMVLEDLLKRAHLHPSVPEDKARPLPLILKQWADALGVSPEDLRRIVKAMREDRMPPLGAWAAEVF